MLAHRVRATVTGKPYFFNRQGLRLRVFQEINARIAFDNYVETGTYLGMTTHFLATTARQRGAQVHSCEINGAFHSIASSVVGNMENVHLYHGNSVDFLQSPQPFRRELTSFISMRTSASKFFHCETSWRSFGIGQTPSL
jgi:hypothetical protein